MKASVPKQRSKIAQSRADKDPTSYFSPFNCCFVACKRDLSPKFVFCVLWYLAASIFKVLILPSGGHENSIAQPKKINYFASDLIFHRLLPFNC